MGNANLNPARRKAAFARATDKKKAPGLIPKAPKTGLLGGLGPRRAGFQAPKTPGIPTVPKSPLKGGW